MRKLANHNVTSALTNEAHHDTNLPSLPLACAHYATRESAMFCDYLHSRRANRVPGLFAVPSRTNVHTCAHPSTGQKKASFTTAQILPVPPNPGVSSIALA